jgi:8-oxo-dGTP diphosphatase
VTGWDGEIGGVMPLEHSAVDWLACGEPAKVAPILPANAPILKALALPTRMAITMAEIEGTERQLERLEEALANGLRLVQVRERSWPIANRLWFAEAVTRVAHDHGALVLINNDVDIARRVGADGLHLPAAALAACTQRPDFAWVGASCHNAAEIVRAGELELDYALLGPVLPTPTHPEAAGLGWSRFADLIAGTAIPVFALGGMKNDLLTDAQGVGAHGIALMRGW